MTANYILTTTEAANCLRCETTDANMLDLLPQVDAYITHATGRNWAADSPIESMAKASARMLLVMWHENPAMIGNVNSLSFGFAAALSILEAKALELEIRGIPSTGELVVAMSMPGDGELNVAVGANLTLVFSEAMAAGVTSQVALTKAGVAVTCVNSLDVTGKILTINPTGNLTAATEYEIVLTGATDQYGRTISETRRFSTL